jgi:hypothetical protein
MHEDEEPILLKSAYNYNGDYIGDKKYGHILCTKMGIMPELAQITHNTCSIGFCDKEQKWYGWSHRAIGGFGIGSKVVKGDCGYRPSTQTELFDALTTPDEDGWVQFGVEDVELLGSIGVRVRYPVSRIISEDPETGECEIVPDGFSYQDILCGKGEWVAETFTDAKQMAIDFAEGVN